MIDLFNKEYDCESSDLAGILLEVKEAVRLEALSGLDELITLDKTVTFWVGCNRLSQYCLLDWIRHGNITLEITERKLSIRYQAEISSGFFNMLGILGSILFIPAIISQELVLIQFSIIPVNLLLPYLDRVAENIFISKEVLF